MPLPPAPAGPHAAAADSCFPAHHRCRRLCEQLLFRPRGGLGRADSEEEVSTACLGSWQTEKEVLCKYVQVLTCSLKEQQSEGERRVAELERWRRQAARGSGGSSSGGGGAGLGTGGAGGGERGQGALGWVRHPALMILCVAFGVVAPPGLPGNALRALPLLALLPVRDAEK